LTVTDKHTIQVLTVRRQEGIDILVVSDMFQTSGSSAEHPQYDFFSDENASKWKDVFVSALSKV